MKELTKISPELQDFMKLNNFESIEEVLAHDDYALLKMEGFGWRLMKEVLGLRQV